MRFKDSIGKTIELKPLSEYKSEADPYEESLKNKIAQWMSNNSN